MQNLKKITAISKTANVISGADDIWSRPQQIMNDHRRFVNKTSDVMSSTYASQCIPGKKCHSVCSVTSNLPLKNKRKQEQKPSKHEGTPEHESPGQTLQRDLKNATSLFCLFCLPEKLL